MDNRYALLVLGCILALPLSNAYAWQVDATLYTDAEYSDNIRKDTTNTEGEMLQVVGLDVGLNEDGKAFQANGSFSLKKEHYFDDAYKDETSLTTGFGLINVGVVDSFLNWRTSFSRTETLNDPLADETPDNREYRNILRTGPQINYRAGRAVTVNILSNYVNVENSDSGTADSERIDTNSRVNYAYNSATSFGLNVGHQEVLDTDSEDDEYRDINVSLGLVRLFNRGSLSIDVGRTRLSSDNSEDTESNFYDVKFYREQVFSHIFFLSYFQDISDSSIGFESDDAINQELVLRGFPSTDVVERRRWETSLERSIDAFTYELTAFWEQEDYDIQLSDTRTRGVAFNLNHNIDETLSFGYGYEFELDNFLSDPSVGKEKSSTYKFDTNKKVSKSFFVTSFLQYEIRQNGNDQNREYEEWSIGLGLNWILL